MLKTFARVSSLSSTKGRFGCKANVPRVAKNLAPMYGIAHLEMRGQRRVFCWKMEELLTLPRPTLPHPEKNGIHVLKAPRGCYGQLNMKLDCLLVSHISQPEFEFDGT